MTLSQIGRGIIVDAPTPDKRKGGLLDVAEVHEGMAFIDPNDMFVSWNCVDVGQTEACGTDQTPAKSFTAPSVVDGTDFVVYLGGQCKPLGADTRAQIDRVFDLRESKGVEKAFEAAVLTAGTTPPSIVSGNTGVVAALASIEQALATGYAGQGTVHMSPAVAVGLMAYDLIVPGGGGFRTALGSKVVIGAGYNSVAMYGTGDVVLYRSERVLVDVPDMANNVVNVLAERAYVAVADCVVYKITDATAIGGP